MTITAKIQAARNLPEVDFVNEWKDRRAYINLKSSDRSFRGDREYQLYIDMQTGELISLKGKGVTSRDFDAAVESVESALI